MQTWRIGSGDWQGLVWEEGQGWAGNCQGVVWEAGGREERDEGMGLAGVGLGGRSGVGRKLSGVGLGGRMKEERDGY